MRKSQKKNLEKSKIILMLISVFLGSLGGSSSSLGSEAELRRQENAALLQAQTDVFRGYLRRIQPYVDHTLDIFAVYSWGDAAHTRRVEGCCEDLCLTGFSRSKIYFDQWNGRPGGRLDIPAYADLILKSQKVIVFGSPLLKSKYERRAGIGVTEEINLLRTRIQRSPEGVLLTWFQGDYWDNFPGGLSSLPARSLQDDYHLSFFDLLSDIFQMDPKGSPLIALKEEFKRVRVIPPETLKDYGERLLDHQSRVEERDAELRERLLAKALLERERSFRAVEEID